MDTETKSAELNVVEPAKPAEPKHPKQDEQKTAAHKTKSSPKEPAQASDQKVKEPASAEPASPFPTVLLYNRWDNAVEVSDPGLKRYLNIAPIVIPRTAGRYGTKSLTKDKMHIVERLVNKMMVSGHRGRKHKLSSGRQPGRILTLSAAMISAFTIIEQKTKQNPLQILVKAVENASLLEEIAAYRLGGMVARKSVIVSPQRRVDVALRHLSQGIQKSAFHNKKHLAEVIADELVAASAADPKSFAITERNRIEKEAEGSR